MRFALLGNIEDATLLMRAAASSSRHTIVPFSDFPAQLVPTPNELEPDDVAEPWESLLAGSDFDAVILAGGSEQSLHEEQFKRFTQEAIPLLVVHPACDVMFAYEIEMARRESGGIILPFAPDWWHPALDRLAEWTRASSDPGRGIQVVWDRKLDERSPVRTRDQFSRDVGPIRRLLGAIHNVSAAGGQDDRSLSAHLTVHCSGPDEGTARWSVVPSGVDQVSRVTVVSDQGTATLQMPGADLPWTIEFRGAEQRTETFPVWNAALSAFDQMERAIQGEAVRPSWSEICLDLEAVESVQKSLRRKRAIDVHTSAASEDQSFKGFMAAGGCLILLIILMAFVFLAVFEGFRLPLRDAADPTITPDPSKSGWPLWLRLWPVYPLVAFLMLQFLLLLAKRPSASGIVAASKD